MPETLTPGEHSPEYLALTNRPPSSLDSLRKFVTLDVSDARRKASLVLEKRIVEMDMYRYIPKDKVFDRHKKAFSHEDTMLERSAFPSLS